MKISFSRIEEARKNPVQFAARSVTTKSHFFSQKNFKAYFFKAMREFHSGESKRKVLADFEARCSTNLSHQNNFDPRYIHYRRILNSYCDSYSSLGCSCVETRKKISLAIGSHRASGLIDRFDMVLPVGYRATVTQLYNKPWKNDLRWPLTQKSLAEELGCPLDQVGVGIFCLETGTYDHVSFAESDVAKAFTEAEALLTAVELSLPP